MCVWILYVVFSTLIAGVSHAAEQPPQKKTITTPGGYALKISAWGIDEDTFDLALVVIGQRAAELEDLTSATLDTSPLAQLNRGLRPAAIAPELSDLLYRGLAISAATGGAFDLTARPLELLWQDCAAANRLPTADEIAQASGLVGYTHVSLAPGGVPELDTLGVTLELTGLLPGYLADEAVLALVHGGATRVLVDCAGAVATWQRPKSAAGGVEPKLFRVDVGHPLDAEQVWGVIELRRGAVATCTAAGAVFAVEGRRLCRIIDPRTGWPVAGVQSVTLTAPSGLEAGALARAVFVMGPVAGPQFVESHEGVEAVIAIDDGQGGSEVYVSPGLIEHFKLQGQR